MEQFEPLNFSYDEQTDVLTIEGIRYAGDLFRGLGFRIEEGRAFRIIERVDGIITISHHFPKDDFFKLAASTVSAPAWRRWMAKLFGKRVESSDNGITVVCYRFRGILYMTDFWENDRV